MVGMYWLHGEMGHDGVLVHCLGLPLLLIDELDDVAKAFSEEEKVQFRDLRCKGKNGAVVENLWFGEMGHAPLLEFRVPHQRSFFRMGKP